MIRHRVWTDHWGVLNHELRLFGVLVWEWEEFPW